MKIFISSPGDVYKERLIKGFAERVPLELNVLEYDLIQHDRR